MKIEAQTLLSLQNFSQAHRGVFSVHDLGNFFLTMDFITLNRRLKPFLKEKILRRFCRGFYVAQDFDLELLSEKISPQSAISLGNILAKEMLIGTIPHKTVYAVKSGKTRIYRSSIGQVIHLGFTANRGKNLWFGYDRVENGIRYADKEKAFLDTLYFYQLGYRFPFNVYSDIQTDRLDLKILRQYLSHYKNPKFRKFVEGVMDGHHSIR
ncbi:MAG: hypothetical protein IPJ69_06600 [Deltaproteobacteria bacterium]|nr:MAG: hypothetical protein IPJ69_06600 [Deltaproteobacteria bacterium]